MIAVMNFERAKEQEQGGSDPAFALCRNHIRLDIPSHGQ
jgi:hypothetical protein